MKQKSVWNYYICNPSIKKLILMSKITFILFFVGLLQVSAASYAQMTKLNLKMTNVSPTSGFSSQLCANDEAKPENDQCITY